MLILARICSFLYGSYNTHDENINSPTLILFTGTGIAYLSERFRDDSSMPFPICNFPVVQFQFLLSPGAREGRFRAVSWCPPPKKIIEAEVRICIWRLCRTGVMVMALTPPYIAFTISTMSIGGVKISVSC